MLLTHRQIFRTDEPELAQRAGERTVPDVGCRHGKLISKVNNQLSCCAAGLQSSDYGIQRAMPEPASHLPPNSR